MDRQKSEREREREREPRKEEARGRMPQYRVRGVGPWLVMRETHYFYLVACTAESGAELQSIFVSHPLPVFGCAPARAYTEEKREKANQSEITR